MVLGMVRAEQMRARDTDCARIMGLLIHGDAAFSGLGLVSESLQLSNVPGVPNARILLSPNSHVRRQAGLHLQICPQTHRCKRFVKVICDLSANE